MEIKKLNTLRGVAVFIVMLSHYSNSSNLFSGFLGHGAGKLGVMIFFLLSGFLMSFLYIHKKFETFEVSNYLIARFARVAPLFIILIIASYTLQQMGFSFLYNIPTIEELFSHLLLLYGSSVLWTIPSEIQFYFIFLFLWWCWSKKESYFYAAVLVIFTILSFFNFPVFEGFFYKLHYKFTIFETLPYFLMGALFGILYKRWKAPASLIHPLYLLSFLLIILLYPKIYFFLFGLKYYAWHDLSILFMISEVFFVLLFLVPDNNIFLSNKIGDFFGKISYSLYLLHLPILLSIKHYAIDEPIVYFFIFLFLSLFTAYLSYLFIEKPLRSKIRRR